jgi:hypothetical protein
MPKYLSTLSSTKELERQDHQKPHSWPHQEDNLERQLELEQPSPKDSLTNFGITKLALTSLQYVKLQGTYIGSLDFGSP